MADAGPGVEPSRWSSAWSVAPNWPGSRAADEPHDAADQSKDDRDGDDHGADRYPRQARLRRAESDLLTEIPSHRETPPAARGHGDLPKYFGAVANSGGKAEYARGACNGGTLASFYIPDGHVFRGGVAGSGPPQRVRAGGQLIGRGARRRERAVRIRSPVPRAAGKPGHDDDGDADDPDEQRDHPRQAPHPSTPPSRGRTHRHWVSSSFRPLSRLRKASRSPSLFQSTI